MDAAIGAAAPAGPRVARRLAELLTPDGVSHVRPFINRLRDHPIEGRLLLVRRAAPVLAFSSRDRLSPQFDLAQQTAREHGFTPVLRAVGGTFAPLHAGSLVVEEYGSSPDASLKNAERFESHTRALVAAYRAAGVAASVGELPGEYCPGRYSIHAGAAKVSGTAQRVSRTAWVVSTVVQVGPAEPLWPVTRAVADVLGQHVDVHTVGSLDGAGALVRTPAEVAPLVVEAFGARPGDGLTLPPPVGDISVAAAPNRDQDPTRRGVGSGSAGRVGGESAGRVGSGSLHVERAAGTEKPPGTDPEGFVWWLRPASIR